MKARMVIAAATGAVVLLGCSEFSKIDTDVSKQVTVAIQNTFNEPGAIQKLSFMKGSWHCVIHGGPSSGKSDNLRYSFLPGGQWMEERGDFYVNGRDEWTIQMWGYDSVARRLVAYQFTPAGAFTKTVDGWVKGVFVSKRDDNGATVIIRPRNKRAFDWVITSADKTFTVVEACRR